MIHLNYHLSLEVNDKLIIYLILSYKVHTVFLYDRCKVICSTFLVADNKLWGREGEIRLNIMCKSLLAGWWIGTAGK